jgi:hypothetical protein
MRCIVRRLTAVLIVLPAAVLWGCGDSPVVAPEQMFIEFDAVAAEAAAGSDVAPRVTVRDGGGRVLARVTVDFAVQGGGGTISVVQAVTDRNGAAVAGTWTLGSGLGENVLAASVRGVERARLVVGGVAGAAVRLEAVGSGLTGRVGRPVETVPGVRAVDRFGHPVGGVEVRFTTSPDQGYVAGFRAITGSDGVARPESWELGTRAGTQRLQAVAGGLMAELLAVAVPGPVARLVAVAGDQQVGVIGRAVELVPRVQATDAYGNATGGEAVSFEVESGGGFVVHPLVVTDSVGEAAAGAWTLGPAVGLNTLTARAAGGTATFMAYAAATDTSVVPGFHSIRTYAGQGSTCPRGRADCRFTVEVRTRDGAPAPGMVVEWSGADGTQLVQATDANGRATAANLGAGTLAGPHAQFARLRITREAVRFDYDLVSPGGFTIDVRYPVPTAPEFRTAIAAAALRWQEVIIGDLPPVSLDVAAGACVPGTPAVNEVVDDVIIFAVIDSIDGPGKVLGSAGPCYVRSAGRLPIMGVIRLDSADVRRLLDQGTFGDLVLHEMGHVLGIGTLWNSLNLMTDRGGANPEFTGMEARSRFQLVGSSAYWPLPAVPVENTGGAGTRDGHWRETVFEHELMTGWLTGATNPLSLVTIGSLADLGYVVNYGAADAFSLVGTSALQRYLREPLHLEEQLIFPIGAR